MPVRKIPISHSSVTGRHALGPGKDSVGYESTLERDFVSLMTFDPGVTGIEEQPVRIEYEDSEGRQRHYTPDYLIERQNKPTLLAEIKPTKFITHDLDDKFEAAKLFAAKRGWVFEVWTEKVIRTPRLQNVRFLLGYRDYPADPGRAARILKQMESDGPMAVEQLLNACWNSDEEERARGLGALWNLVAVGKLQADLDRELTMESILKIPGRPS
ncbi:TnsA endonuclease N-terminal domain-containing protein [Pseudomonadota bacterium]